MNANNYGNSHYDPIKEETVKVPVTPKIDPKLYKQIYYKGHYVGRKLERRHLEAKHAEEIAKVRDAWNEYHESTTLPDHGPVFRRGMYLGAGFAITLYVILTVVRDGLK